MNQFKMLGLAVEMNPAHVDALGRKQNAIWCGEGSISPKLLKGIVEHFYPSEFVAQVKLKLQQEDEIEEFYKEGGAWVVGWLPPSTKDKIRGNLYISMTEACLVPWFKEVGLRVANGDYRKAIPMLANRLTEAMIDQSALKPEELSEHVLRHGCINHAYVDKYGVLGLAWLHYLSNGPWRSIHALQSWSTTTWEEDDNGDIIPSDPSTAAWLLAPKSEIGYRSPMGEYRAHSKVACGFAIPDSSGMSMSIREQPSPTLWKSLQSLMALGIPCILEEKSRALFIGGSISQDGKYSYLLGGTKLPKLTSRPKMPTGDQATLDPRYHQTVVDYACMRTATGELIPFQKGVLIESVISNFSGWGSSGVSPCKMEFHTLSERVIRSQVTNEQHGQLSLDSIIGQTFEPGKSILGYGRTLTNSKGYPFTVTGVSHEHDKDEAFWNITVKGHIAETSKVVKLRGPAKAQTVPHDLIKDWEFPWPEEWANAKLLLGPEEVKLPVLAMALGWANATQTCVVLTESGEFESPDQREEFVKWVKENTKTIELKVRLVARGSTGMRRALEATGRKIDKRGYTTMLVTYLLVPLVFGVESIPATIRGGRASMTPAMHMSVSMGLRKVQTFKESERSKGMIYSKEWEQVRAADVHDVASTPWSDFMQSMKSKFKSGSLIKIPTPLGTWENLFLDWKVIELFSHGDVSPDDALTQLIQRFLVEYVEMANAHVKMGKLPLWTQPTDELAKDAWNEFQKHWKQCNSLLSRVKGAMSALGFSGGMLRRMTSPARVTPFLVSIGLNFIPQGTVLVHPKTMEKYHMWDDTGSKVDGKKSLLMRFPGDGFARVRVWVNDSVPEGVIWCSTWDQQVGTKGDSDGDQNLLVEWRTTAALISMSRQDREMIARYFRMLGFNQSVNPVPPIEYTYTPNRTVYWPEEAEKIDSASPFKRYSRFTEFENTPIVEWGKQVAFPDASGPLAMAFDVATYTAWAEQISRFNTSGIGHAYNIWHVSVMMMALSYRRDWGMFQVWSRVMDLAATLYEDVFLAAGPKPSQWALFELLETAKIDDLGKIKVALRELGMTKIEEPFVVKSASGNEIEVDVVKWLLKARHMVIGYQSHFTNGWLPKATKSVLEDFARFVPLMGFMRALLSFQMKPSWMAKYPTNEEIREMLSLVHPESPIIEYYGGLITSLYPFAIEVARNQAEHAYMQAMTW